QGRQRHRDRLCLMEREPQRDRRSFVVDEIEPHALPVLEDAARRQFDAADVHGRSPVSRYIQSNITMQATGYGARAVTEGPALPARLIRDVCGNSSPAGCTSTSRFLPRRAPSCAIHRAIT